MLTAIVNYDNHTFKWAKEYPRNTCHDACDDDYELIFDSLNNAYAENRDNGDEYDQDEEEYCEWVRVELPFPDDTIEHDFINDTDEDFGSILKNFVTLNVIEIREGKCILN